jgi:heterodisulfide reductase subunit B
MKFAIFLGCNIPVRVEGYALSARQVLGQLGVNLININEFNCCGYPLRNTQPHAYLLAAARNLALAEAQNLDILALCKCCFGTLKHAQHTLKEASGMRKELNRILHREGLAYEGIAEVKHLLSVLHRNLGLERIRKRVVKPHKEMKIATHYGCHALRPAEITGFDDPFAPTLFDELVEATGAKSIFWENKLQCCGAPLMGANDELSVTFAQKKLTAALQAGADYLCSACPYCHLQFRSLQRDFETKPDTNGRLPIILYTQLLGISMGIESQNLGLDDQILKAFNLQSS